IEVARLDLLLCLLERLVDPRVNDRLVLLQAKLLQHSIKLVGAEDAHEVIFERQEKLGMTRVALPARTAAQLVVDAAARVPLGAVHKEATCRERLSFQPRNLLADLLRARA